MRLSAVRFALLGVLIWGCAPQQPAETAPERDPSSGGKSGGTAGSGGSGGGTASSNTGGSTGTGGATVTGGATGSSSGGTSGEAAGSGGASGTPDAAAAETAAPAGDTGPSAQPVPSGAFAPCPKCKSIFDGKTFEGWEQAPAGAFVIKDGTIASTGKDGYAWTKEDYGDFRLFFSVRQIRGNHKPCTTLFTTRPGGGGKVTRGLAGIQFQPPLGGSWDYRPGKNSGPNKTNWTYPDPRPQFDVMKWNRCEILARASTGEFWGACCEIEGKDTCKGQQVVYYKDATAGKKGPFALMMHNAGLFDEFKDFWIETDPVGNELLSTK